MRALSGGMKRRVMVAQALVHRPPVIVLDEPTAGVDVELRQTLWEFISRLNRDGHTIVLTTHYLEEAESLCDRIAMMRRGEWSRWGTSDAAAALPACSCSCASRRRAAGRLRPLEAGAARSTNGRQHCCASRATTTSSGFSRSAAQAGAIREMEVRKADLEDVFVQVMNGPEVVEGLA